MIQIKTSNDKFNEEEFDNLEKKLEVILPKNYKRFLEINNGGMPELNIIELEDEEIESFSITEFFGIGISAINDLKYQFEMYKERIPNRNLPICRVEGGNVVCMNIDHETISLWDHDTELIDNDTLSVKSLIKVANGFEEFLSIIKPYDQDVDEYKVNDVWIDPDFIKELNKERMDSLTSKNTEGKRNFFLEDVIKRSEKVLYLIDKEYPNQKNYAGVIKEIYDLVERINASAKAGQCLKVKVDIHSLLRRFVDETTNFTSPILEELSIVLHKL
ncbi:SMI1/KNR4 family protein [Oceanobacillus iheyensis]|uniref:SMI1/KNR4 family protein n=1 Tax=Oceanobacillus iheyensis TaxID=182710 RepID=UPI0036343D5C